jgi:HD-GYP domain-containing protein (c-di-GMP phosphodiesterase class II)
MSADATACPPITDGTCGNYGSIPIAPRVRPDAEPRASAGLSDSEKIRSVLAALLRMSLDDGPLEGLLQHVLEHILSIPWLAIEAKGAIFLAEESARTLVMKAQKNMAAPLLTMCARVPFGHCLCGRAALSAEVEYADCIDHRHDVRFEGMTGHGHYVVPIIFRGKMLGVLNLYVAEGHRRDRREEEFLLAVADLLAGILVHKKTQRELEIALAKLKGTMGTIIQAMGTTLERRDPYTAGHQRRVADLARAIAVELQLSQDCIDAIYTAATIHDIGKIAIPAEILCKPGKLNDTELALIKMHPKVGYDILRSIDFSWPIARIVLQHHERLDGSGYPAGLSGEHILLEARILAVADVVEAMATHRPYRPAWSLEDALAEVSKKRREAYDATVADACVKIFTEKGFKLQP